MAKLPRPSSKEIIQFLIENGFGYIHTRGDHHIFQSNDGGRFVSVPERKETGRGLLRSILKQAGLDVNDFRQWYS